MQNDGCKPIGSRIWPFFWHGTSRTDSKITELQGPSTPTRDRAGVRYGLKALTGLESERRKKDMHESKQFCCWLLLGLFIGILNGSAITNNFTFSNTPGTDAVGLRVVPQYDYSRSYQGKTDVLGKPTQGERARPVQTLIWYPAQDGTAKRVTFGEYLELSATQENFKQTPEVAAGILAPLRKDYRGVLPNVMWAIKDAPAQPGNFPVIIYAPSFGAPAFENADLCEYLASNGYIVIASPSLGARPLGMTDDLEGAETQARDISFLIGFARTIPQADLSEIAVAGFSWGGIANFFAAAQDSRITALVALDGSVRYHQKTVKDATYLQLANLALPVLFFTQKEMTLEEIARKKTETKVAALDDLVHCDLWIARMHEMVHGAFASFYQRSDTLTAAWYNDQVTPQVVSTSYGWVARYTLEFLNAYLKHDSAGMDFLNNPVTKNGVPPLIMDIEHHEGTGIPPTITDFAPKVAARGFDHAAEVYSEQRAADPTFRIEEQQLIGWADALSNGNNFKEATAIFKATISIYPDSWLAYAELGDTYHSIGDNDSAIKSYQSAIEKNPANDYLKAQLKMLKKEAGKPDTR
jgi:dienelactone hydrolase